MAKAKSATNSKARDKSHYTRLFTYPKRRAGLLLVVLFYVLLFTTLLQKEIPAGTPWLALVVPITLAGILLLFFPATEEWEYTPWQNTKQKQERTFFD